METKLQFQTHSLVVPKLNKFSLFCARKMQNGSKIGTASVYKKKTLSVILGHEHPQEQKEMERFVYMDH